MKTCPECLGDGYIQCPNCDGKGFVEDEQLQIPGEDWSKYEQAKRQHGTGH